MAGPYWGDFVSGSRVMLSLTTTDTTGAPTAITSGSACVRKLNGDTTLAFAGAGAITTSGGLSTLSVFTASASAFFVTSMDYECFLGAGTVSGTSVIGYAYGTFSLDNRGLLRPTVATRTLDVSAAGEAGIDWANIGGPTTTQNLTATTILGATATLSANVLQIASSNVNTASAQLGVNVVNIAGAGAAAFTMSANVTQIATAAVNTSSAQLGVNVVNIAGSGAAAFTMSSNVVQWKTATPNALISGRVDANAAAVTVTSAVISIANSAISASTFAAGAVDAAALATDAVNEIADGMFGRSLGAEAYAAVAAVPTFAQMMFMQWAVFAQFAIATTTITALKLDGSTSAMTFGMDAGASTATQRIRIT